MRTLYGPVLRSEYHAIAGVNLAVECDDAMRRFVGKHGLENCVSNLLDVVTAFGKSAMIFNNILFIGDVYSNFTYLSITVATSSLFSVRLLRTSNATANARNTFADRSTTRIQMNSLLPN